MAEVENSQTDVMEEGAGLLREILERLDLDAGEFAYQMTRRTGRLVTRDEVSKWVVEDWAPVAVVLEGRKMIGLPIPTAEEAEEVEQERTRHVAFIGWVRNGFGMLEGPGTALAGFGALVAAALLGGVISDVLSPDSSEAGRPLPTPTHSASPAPSVPPVTVPMPRSRRTAPPPRRTPSEGPRLAGSVVRTPTPPAAPAPESSGELSPPPSTPVPAPAPTPQPSAAPSPPPATTAAIGADVQLGPVDAQVDLDP